MSTHPRTDAITYGCSFSPWNQKVVNHANTLEEELAAMTLRAEKAEQKATAARKALVEASMAMPGDNMEEFLDDVLTGIAEMDSIQ